MIVLSNNLLILLQWWITNIAVERNVWNALFWVKSIVRSTFFHILGFHSRDETAMQVWHTFYIIIESNSQKSFFAIALYTNMAAVTSCENREYLLGNIFSFCIVLYLYYYCNCFQGDNMTDIHRLDLTKLAFHSCFF